ncbi:MAG: hypothetical protein LUI13_08310 [Lachnospiraceae bacterium]|nr:hypothetical protein [Lachnospiraceae bacterium]
MITMKKAIKNQFQINENKCLAVLLLELGFFLAGMLLLAILMRVVIDEGDGTFPLATIAAAFAGAVFLFANFGEDYTSQFHTQISLGCTRKGFFVSVLLNHLVLSTFGMVILLVFARAEDALNVRLYPMEEPEFAIFPILLRYGIAAVLGLPAAAALFGTLCNRFGQSVRIVFFILWMMFWFGMQWVMEAITEQEKEIPGLFRGIAGVITAVPSGMWPVIGALALILALGGAWRLLRKQQVN